LGATSQVLDLENPKYLKTSAMKLDLLTNVVVIDDTRKKRNLEREQLLQ
jgi:hypothetical protein